MKTKVNIYYLDPKEGVRLIHTLECTDENDLSVESNQVSTVVIDRYSTTARGVFAGPADKFYAIKEEQKE